MQCDDQLKLSGLSSGFINLSWALMTCADISKRTSEQVDWARYRSQRRSYRETTKERRRVTGSDELGMIGGCRAL